MRFALAALLIVALACRTERKPESTRDTTGVDTSGVSDSPVSEEGALEELGPKDFEIPSDSGPRPRAAPSMDGLPVGAYAYRADEWCSGILTGAIFATQPQYVTSSLRKAQYCNIRVGIVMPRSGMTTNGKNVGTFSPARAEAFADKWATALRQVPAELQPYLEFVSTLDDMACEACWPPNGISKQATSDFTRYAHNVFPSWVPVALRIHPGWMLGVTNWGVDVTLSQWHEGKGPRNLSGVPKQTAWYTQAQKDAATLGIKRQMYNVNIGKCAGGKSAPCSPDKLKSYLTNALNFDAAHNCGSVNWLWIDDHEKNVYQVVWQQLVDLAKSKPKLSCRE